MTSAEKDFLKFPAPVQSRMRAALEIAATGEMADIARPLKGMDTGVYELRVAYRTDAFRAIYAVRIGTDIWVVHAFQKKSKKGVKTPRQEINLVRSRLSRLKERYK